MIILAPIVQKEYKESNTLGQRALRILESKELRKVEVGVLEEVDLTTVMAGRNGMRVWTQLEEKLVEKSLIVKKQRRRRQTLNRVLGSIAIFAIVGLCIGVTYLWQRSEYNNKISYSRLLAQYAIQEKQSGNFDRGMRLAMKAWKESPDKETLNIYDALVFSKNLERNTFGLMTASFGGHEGAVVGGQISSDNKSILTFSGDSTVKLWDTKGNLLIDFKEHKNSVKAAVFSDDASLIASCSEDKTALLWDTSGEVVAVFPRA